MEFDKNPANFFQVESSSIKTAQKDGTTITFTHLVETSMVVKDLAGDKFFGCEFVKAESGFNCHLCNQYIRDSRNVMSHIESKNHKNSYQNFLRKNPNYEKKQKQQNEDLSEALAKAEKDDKADDKDKVDDEEKVEADDEMEVKDEIEGDTSENEEGGEDGDEGCDANTKDTDKDGDSAENDGEKEEGGEVENEDSTEDASNTKDTDKD